MVADGAQYASDAKLVARQRLWAESRSEPRFSLHPWVVGVARLRGGEAVLDVGCGNGAYLEVMGAVGLDRSVGMLEAARRRTEGPVVAGDAVALPFLGASFDVALAAHMLFHVGDRPAAVAELRRVLRPGGRCVAVTNGQQNLHELLEVLETEVGHGWRWRRASDVAFSMENGAAQLEASFAHVELVPYPATVTAVTDASLVADYLRSVGDLYQDQVEEPWEAIVGRCERVIASVIERRGAFELRTAMGAFVCQ